MAAGPSVGRFSRDHKSSSDIGVDDIESWALRLNRGASGVDEEVGPMPIHFFLKASNRTVTIAIVLDLGTRDEVACEMIGTALRIRKKLSKPLFFLIQSTLDASRPP